MMIRIERTKLWSVATLFCGSIVLILWVLFRFSAKSINFDLVGQQLLARQWIEGDVEGSVIGPTNYILKILFAYIPAELVGVDQKLFLIISAIAINILTFVGIYFVLRKILDLFSIQTGNFFNLAMLWLAGIAGFVFWVQYTNSRNIELLAGLTLLYLGLILYKKMSLQVSLLFLFIAGLTYFSDPLQLFTTSTILVSYVALHSLFFQKEKKREPFFIMLLVVLGYLMAKVLTFITGEVTGAQFIAVNAHPQFQEIVTHLSVVGIETAKNTIRLLAGTNEIGDWRQGINIIVVGIFLALSLTTLLTNKTYIKHRSFSLFVSLMVIVPLAVYVASGQPALVSDTSRYLIVLAPALIILFSAIDLEVLPEKIRRMSILVLISFLVISIGALFLATIRQGNSSFLTTSYLESRYNYLEKNHYDYGYASMDTAIPSMYFLAKNKNQVLLPLSCEGEVLRKTILFYDKGVFAKNEKSNTRVPIILDGDSINNSPNVCTIPEIKKQLGEPIAVDSYETNTVLIYDSSKIVNLGF